MACPTSLYHTGDPPWHVPHLSLNLLYPYWRCLRSFKLITLSHLLTWPAGSKQQLALLAHVGGTPNRLLGLTVAGAEKTNLHLKFIL